MSKTYLDYLAKAEMLVGGLKNNYDEIKSKGVNADELAQMETMIAEGRTLEAEVERLRVEMNAVYVKANEKLTAVKDKTAELKRIVKQNISAERWLQFGIPDKR